MSQSALRVFLSSPGDVLEERRIVMRVVDRLNASGEVSVPLEIIAWDDPEKDVPLMANLTPQSAINMGMLQPAECDIVLVILWSRMGTPLPLSEYSKPDGSQYLSGTEWEYENALAAYDPSTQRPRTYVYRRIDPVTVALNDPNRLEKQIQFDRLESFFTSFRDPNDGSLIRSYNEYSLEEFESKIEQHLRNVRAQLLQKDTEGNATPETGEHIPQISLPRVERTSGNRDTWLHVKALEEAHRAQVYIAGPNESLARDGSKRPYRERYSIYDWLTSQNILFYDNALIHHKNGETWETAIDQVADEAARIHYFEFSPREIGVRTLMRLATHVYAPNHAIVIYFSNPGVLERMPDHSSLGFPLFVPELNWESEMILRAHYEAAREAGKLARRLVVEAASKLHALTVTFGEQPFEGDTVISPDRLHLSDIYRAWVQAASGRRTILNFVSVQGAIDEAGYPLLLMPSHPREVELHALLDQYVDEGNTMRREILNQLRASVYSRVVYTQTAAALALRELMMLSGLTA